MRIAVTGASGGIGRAVVKLAEARGHLVTGIDHVAHDEVAQSGARRFVMADTRDYEAILAAVEGCNAVIHLAAIPTPGRHPDHVVHNNNVVGSFNIMQAAADQGIRRICLASSVNAIGHAFSRKPRYDYFPIDEDHPNYCEDPYSLSKWICEQQAEAFARRYPDMVIASLRFHYVCDEAHVAERAYEAHRDVSKHLWAYTRRDAAAEACLLSLTASFAGHEAFYIVAPYTLCDTPSCDLADKFLPGVRLRDDWTGCNSFFDTRKAGRMLGWKHPERKREVSD